MRWVLYYGDGSTFSSEDGTPDEAPRRNGQVALQQCAVTDVMPEGRYLVHGRDGFSSAYFCWHGEWIGHDTLGLLDCLESQGLIATSDELGSLSLDLIEKACVVLGRTLPDTEFYAILNRALADPYIPAVRNG